MSQFTTVLVSCLVFLVSLILFKAVFAALAITSIFLLLTILLEAAGDFRQSPLFLAFAKPAVGLSVSVALALGFYVLFYLPVEFLITEIWLITPKIPSLLSLILLLGLVIILGSFDWSKLLKRSSLKFSLVVFIVFSSLIYSIYRQHKLAREYLPKIYKIHPNFGIQAQVVEIRGVNFFPPWKKGKVFLGGQEMIIRSTDEKLIVAEQPVPVRFGQVDLFVVRADGMVSNKVWFQIRNPDELKNLK